jgi:hypothetical protein
MQKREKKLRIYRKCPRCGGVGYMIDWQPGPGHDPLLRQFECLSCRRQFYALIHAEQTWQEREGVA